MQSSATAIKKAVLEEYRRRVRETSVTALILFSPTPIDFNRFAREMNAEATQVAGVPVSLIESYEELTSNSQFITDIWSRLTVLHVRDSNVKGVVDPLQGQLEVLLASPAIRHIIDETCEIRGTKALSTEGKVPRLTLCGVGDAAKICKASADNPEMTVLGQTVAELREGSSQVANLIVVATISGPDSFDILRLFHGGGGCTGVQYQARTQRCPTVRNLSLKYLSL